MMWISTKKVNLTFLRTNTQSEHNWNMNNVDVADQCRGNYRFDKWCRNNKWWMALFFWNHGNVHVNAFKFYVGANIDAWSVCGEENKSKCLHDHYEHKKGDCIAMIDPEGYYHDICRYGTINNFTLTNK